MNKKSTEPNVFVCDACSQRCVFCSAEGEDRRMSEREKLAAPRPAASRFISRGRR